MYSALVDVSHHLATLQQRCLTAEQIEVVFLARDINLSRIFGEKGLT